MSNPVTIGSTLGQYRIDGLLGRGGMGVVYGAFDTKLNRRVALKFLSEEIADGQARRRFQREAELASSLNHPHILTVHDAGEWDGQQYVVTEFVDGGTLSSWAAAEPRSWRQCVELLTGVVEGLAAAHEAHILHRDIKPGNILVSQAGYAKLADFGLAKLQDNSPADEMPTRSGAILGTTAYMSPEQATGGKCDSRSDIFSMGVVFYEVLSGKRPFEGASSPEVVRNIIHQQPPALPDSIPAALRNVVEKALEKEPADRYQSLRDMVVDLRRIARRTDSGREVAPATVAAPADATRRLRWWIPAAVLLVAAAVVAGLSLRPKTTNSGRLQRFQIAPPTGGRFVIGSLPTLGGMAVSPDGEMFSFVATVDDVTSLWVQPFNGGARKIEGAALVQRPFWSPDSKSIGYFGSGGLFRVDAAGGAPILISKWDTAYTMAGSWSDDGTILFSDGIRGLFSVSASGGEPKQLLPAGAYFPQVLPNGAFLYSGAIPDGPGIYAATMADPKRAKRLFSLSDPAFGTAVYAAGYVLWPDGGALLAQMFDPKTLSLSGQPQRLLEPIAVGTLGELTLTVSTTGRLIYDAEGNDKQLTWYARTGQRVGSVGPAGSYQSLRLFDNGRRIVAQANATKDRGVWLIDDRGLASRITSDFSVNPTPSTDGKFVFFFGVGAGIQRADFSGGNPVTLKTAPAQNFQFPTDISGDLLLFCLVSSTSRNDIWSVRLAPDGNQASGAVPVSYLQTPATETSARFAPNQHERWLAYQSDESGRMEVYVQSFPVKGEKLAISKNGGVFPGWAPGGRELYYVAPDNKLMVVDVKFGASSASASAPRELFPIPLTDTALTASPFDTIDGQRFLVLTPVAPATRPLQVIDNWQALLKH
jgi:eukaryotic-like serine/threonine-protein kinase